MAHLLHLDSSPRSFPGTLNGHQSVTRMLTQEFVTAWQAAHPDETVMYRDIGRNPIPPVSEEWIAAAYTPPEQRSPELAAALKISDELVDEFLRADICVFGIPMYNFSVPSTFKAYIDQIVRVGRTFTIDANGFEGLAVGKQIIVITARGGSFRPGTSLAAYDHQEPYLRTIFKFIGIADVHFIHADRLNPIVNDESTRNQSIAKARAATKEVALLGSELAGANSKF
ncbi:FMN-dependent NADH-azoreductase [Candidatus Gracilibacteria bacterium]|nr:FMN-dependent NADH-azoreductase [Candidatus Gracilibacteria bacterium]NJM86169.1 FMN-dependent NADH-azoreductase [Hydrococcus sp. RU_2_2]NJP19129.1 FMN-dependent NADH-azoreductase [Hydrococcus sp. CRU_1_1]NJQ96538.1 FMN-dependent NADH-azoreductase [Hydrococcus sp. CSU_1_8]